MALSALRQLEDIARKNSGWFRHMPRTTPIKNMFMVGDACQSPGIIGTSGCADDAMDVANIIKEKVKTGVVRWSFLSCLKRTLTIKS